MKTLNYLLVILSFATTISCSDKVEDSFKEVETNLTMDIPIVSESSHDATSQSDYSFSGYFDNTISNMINWAIVISNIYEVTPRSGSTIVLSGITENYEINSLSLNWDYQSSINPNNVIEKSIDLLSLDYTFENGVFQVNIDDEIADLISKIDDKNGALKVELAGLCNNNLSCTASLNVPVTIESLVNSPRFEVF